MYTFIHSAYNYWASTLYNTTSWNWGEAMDYSDIVGPKGLLLNSHLHQQVYFTNYSELYTVEFKSWLLFNYRKILP